MFNSENQYQCDFCNKSFEFLKYLKRHKKLHEDDRKYKCEECGKAYRRSDHLTRHQVSHKADSKPFNCKFCVTRFSNRSHLNRHIKMFHNGQILECEQCDAKFNKKAELVRHSVVHSGHKPYICHFPFCNQSYFKQGQLDLHIKNKHSIEAIPQINSLVINNSNEKEIKTTFIEINKESTQDDSYSCYSNEVGLLKCKSDRKYLMCPFTSCTHLYSTNFNLRTHLRNRHFDELLVLDLDKHDEDF